MDAFLGLYDNGSDSDDDEWISQLEIGDPLASNSNQKKNLPPEPQSGNIEYKLKLVNPSEQRIQHLVTQVLLTRVYHGCALVHFLNKQLVKGCFQL
jgi:hypothetical protein